MEIGPLPRQTQAVAQHIASCEEELTRRRRRAPSRRLPKSRSRQQMQGLQEYGSFGVAALGARPASGLILSQEAMCWATACVCRGEGPISGLTPVQLERAGTVAAQPLGLCPGIERPPLQLEGLQAPRSPPRPRGRPSPPTTSQATLGARLGRGPRAPLRRGAEQGEASLTAARDPWGALRRLPASGEGSQASGRVPPPAWASASLSRRVSPHRSSTRFAPLQRAARLAVEVDGEPPAVERDVGT